MTYQRALQELEDHFYILKDEWPITLDGLTDTFDQQIEIAVRFISKHPRCKLFWAPIACRPNYGMFLFMTKWSMKKTIKHFRSPERFLLTTK